MSERKVDDAERDELDELMDRMSRIEARVLQFHRTHPGLKTDGSFAYVVFMEGYGEGKRFMKRELNKGKP